MEDRSQWREFTHETRCPHSQCRARYYTQVPSLRPLSSWSFSFQDLPASPLTPSYLSGKSAEHDSQEDMEARMQ